MSKTFDLSTLNLPAGEYEITVKARASGYLDSEPSNTVLYVVVPAEEPDEPEENKFHLVGFMNDPEHQIADKILIDPNNFVEDYSNNTSTLYNEGYGLKIVITGVSEGASVLGDEGFALTSGQTITLYPFCTEEGELREDMLGATYDFAIPFNPNGPVRYYNPDGVGEAFSINSWRYPKFLLTCYFDGGNGKMKLKDELTSYNTNDEYEFGATSTSSYSGIVDFTRGVTIEVL